MVLGARLKVIVLTLFSAGLLSMTSRTETMDSVVIDRARLGLIEWDAVCLIEYEGAIHAIGLAAGTMPIPSAWSGHGTHDPSS